MNERRDTQQKRTNVAFVHLDSTPCGQTWYKRWGFIWISKDTVGEKRLKKENCKKALVCERLSVNERVQTIVLWKDLWCSRFSNPQWRLTFSVESAAWRREVVHFRATAKSGDKWSHNKIILTLEEKGRSLKTHQLLVSFVHMFREIHQDLSTPLVAPLCLYSGTSIPHFINFGRLWHFCCWTKRTHLLGYMFFLFFVIMFALEYFFLNFQS